MNMESLENMELSRLSPEQPPPNSVTKLIPNSASTTSVHSLTKSNAVNDQNFLPSAPVENEDPLSVVLSQHSRFLLGETEDHGLDKRIQIKNESGEVIMSSVVDGGTTWVTTYSSSSGIKVRPQRTVRFSDPRSGDIIMAAKGTGKVMSVTSQDRKLGVIHGCSGMFPNIILTDPAGLPICSILQDPSILSSMIQRRFIGLPSFRAIQHGSARKFIAGNGQELGRAGFFEDSDIFEIRLSPGLDSSTKALLVTTGFFIFLFFHAHTAFGETGTAGAEKCRCSWTLLVSLIVFIIFIVVITHVFNRLQEPNSRATGGFGDLSSAVGVHHPFAHFRSPPRSPVSLDIANISYINGTGGAAL